MQADCQTGRLRLDGNVCEIFKINWGPGEIGYASVKWV